MAQQKPASASITQPIRESYDRLADEYAIRIAGELEHKPFDRDLLNRFANLAKGRGTVCDMGCGPGQVARYLHESGVAVFGLDLSGRMLEEARKLNPEISFREGNMLALGVEDESLAGIVAFYAIVNLPRDFLPQVFREMHRVLRPGGRLLIAFHAGERTLQENELWGRPISMQFFLFPTAEIAREIASAGLVIEEALERDPYPPEVEYQSRRAYILALKPATPAPSAAP